MGKTFKNRGHKDKPKHSNKPTKKDNWKKYKGTRYHEDSEI